MSHKLDLLTIQQLVIWILPVFCGITVHEFAHGWVAYQLGDATAYRQGRVTINPLKHVDLIGTLLLPLALFFSGSSFIFGWAKPVPVNFRNLRRPRVDTILVAVAGPGANLFMALLWGLIAKFSYLILAENWVGVPLFLMGLVGMSFNLVLMVVNLLPIPPLDGGRILISFLPAAVGRWFARYESLTLLLLILVLTTGVITPTMIQVAEGIYYFLLTQLSLIQPR